MPAPKAAGPRVLPLPDLDLGGFHIQRSLRLSGRRLSAGGARAGGGAWWLKVEPGELTVTAADGQVTHLDLTRRRPSRALRLALAAAVALAALLIARGVGPRGPRQGGREPWTH